MRATNHDGLAPARGCLFGAAAGLIFWLVAGLAFCSCAGADERAAEKRVERVEKIVILAAFAAIDYGHTCRALFGTGRGNHYEANPILGMAPSRRDLLAFGLVGIGLTWLAAEFLPEPWATVAIDSVLASEQWNIEDTDMILDGMRPRTDAIPIIITWRF